MNIRVTEIEQYRSLKIRMSNVHVQLAARYSSKFIIIAIFRYLIIMEAYVFVSIKYFPLRIRV